MIMKTLTVADFKTNFSDVLQSLKQGQSFTVSYGRKKSKIAVILPYDKYEKETVRKLGLLEGKANYRITPHFKMTDNELLES